jgi:hypothetical protein
VRALDENDWHRLLGIVQYPEGDRTVDHRIFGWVRGKSKKMLLGSADASRAIESIPVSGPVSAAAWARFVRGYTTAFKPTALATASRLLALRRPDLFLSANLRSRKVLEQTLGMQVRNLDDYWHLHQVMWSWPWARAPKPKGKQMRRNWDARVALLDVLFYLPPGEDQ